VHPNDNRERQSQTQTEKSDEEAMLRKRVKRDMGEMEG
jgi:hypothetical protein